MRCKGGVLAVDVRAPARRGCRGILPQHRLRHAPGAAQVEPDGALVHFVSERLPPAVAAELEW